MLSTYCFLFYYKINSILLIVNTLSQYNSYFYYKITMHTYTKNISCIALKKKIMLYMPQLVPFYFVNQITFAFTLLVILIYVFSKYILPRFVRLFTSRVFISKL